MLNCLVECNSSVALSLSLFALLWRGVCLKGILSLSFPLQKLASLKLLALAAPAHPPEADTAIHSMSFAAQHQATVTGGVERVANDDGGGDAIATARGRLYCVDRTGERMEAGDDECDDVMNFVHGGIQSQQHQYADISLHQQGVHHADDSLYEDHDAHDDYFHHVESNHDNIIQSQPNCTDGREESFNFSFRHSQDEVREHNQGIKSQHHRQHEGYEEDSIEDDGCYHHGGSIYNDNNEGRVYCYYEEGTMDVVDLRHLSCPQSLFDDERDNYYDADDELRQQNNQDEEFPVRSISIDDSQYCDKHDFRDSFEDGILDENEGGGGFEGGMLVVEENEEQLLRRTVQYTYSERVSYEQCDNSPLDVIGRIEAVVGSLVTSLGDMRGPVLREYQHPVVSTREDESSVDEEHEEVYHPPKEQLEQFFEYFSNATGKDVKIFDDYRTDRTFTSITKVMAFIHQLLLSNRTTTTREVYYVFVTHFRNQKECDGAILDVAKILNVPRRALGLSASPKGELEGRSVYMEIICLVVVLTPLSRHCCYPKAGSADA